MSKRASPVSLVQLGLDHRSGVPLHRQVYDQLREAVLSRRLSPGARLPSTRTLARELGASRNTVMIAFEQLLAEGYIEGKTGSGTFVTRILPEDMLYAHGAAAPRLCVVEERRSISRRGEALRRNPFLCCLYKTDTEPPQPGARRGDPSASQEDNLPRPFRVGWPAIDEFPAHVWGRLASRVWREPPRSLLVYGDPAGYRPLREAIATYLREARGVRCEAGQVIIVGGCQQALDLAARVLLDPGDAVWIEDPGYLGARSALLGAGATLIPVPVDREGLDVAAGVARRASARAAYVTPSHQYPLGVTMSLARRLALLSWAARSGAWVLEDDYDSEYRYTGRPLAAIQGLDGGARVVYLGSFSKVLFPSLRLGYLVAPPDLVDAFTAARSVSGRHSPVADQAILARFMTEGHFARHIRRTRHLYAERRAMLLEAARRELAGLLEIEPGEAGLHVPGWLPKGVDDRAAAETAAARGVEVFPLSACALKPLARGGLLLGFAALNGPEICEGVRRLATALEALRTRAGAARQALKAGPPAPPASGAKEMKESVR